MSDLTNRLDRVEAEMRRARAEIRMWRRGVLVLLIAAAGAGIVARGVPASAGGPADAASGPLRTGSLEIVDEQGRVRAHLYSNLLNGGAATLVFHGAKHEMRLNAGETATGASIVDLFGKDAKFGVTLAATPTGVASISVHDTAGTPRARISTAADGTAAMSLTDGEGKAVWTAPK